MPPDRSLRLTFDDCALEYDAVRPGYPDAMFDALAPYPSRVVEIGCGTGQATRSLLARGVRPLCVEPGPNLARLFRAKFPDLDLVEAEFEAWEPTGRYGLLFAASCWHWIDPAVKYAKARAVADRLALAFRWPATFSSGFHERVQEAYAAHWPGSSGPPEELEPRVERMAAEIEAGYATPEVRRFPVRQRFTAAEYVRRMRTWSDHRALADAPRLALEEHVARIVGDGAEVDDVVLLFTAARPGG